MRTYKLYLFVFLAISACGPQQTEETSTDKSAVKIEVNTSGAENTSLKAANFEVEYLSIALPEAVLTGEISHLKQFGDYLFLHNPDLTKTITITDLKGNYIGQLNSVGRGPGEYTQIAAFTFDEDKEHLIIYDRGQQRLLTYSVPNLEFVTDSRVDRYMMNIEQIDTDFILAFSEEELNATTYEGVITMKNNGSLLSNIDIDANAASMELSYPNTVSLINGEVYYAHPHEITTIYKMTKNGAEEVFKIDFGNNGIPEKYWARTEADEFESALEEGNKATWVQHFTLNNQLAAFWYMYIDPSNKQLAVYNRQTNEVKSYKQFTIDGTEVELPYPIGTINDKFVSIIYSDELSPENVKDNPELYKAVTENQSEQGLTLIVYSPKN